MCLAPILIDNPNYNSPITDPLYHKLHNTTDSKIPVPCGRCASCVHLRQIYLVQRVQMESLNNDLYYGTLTYNQESLPTVKYGDLSFAYPDIRDWQNMIKMVRKYYPYLKFRYMVVSEYGTKKHRPHFHFLLSFPRTSDLLAEKWSMATELFDIFLRYWRRNYGSTRSPVWRPLCTYKRLNGKYNYDLHWLDPNSSNDGLDGVSFYVTKYLLKYDPFVEKFKSKLYFSLSHDDYRDAWSLFRPRCLLSKGFGSPNDKDVQSHILKGINFALDFPSAFYPYYISRVNGSTYPLSPYYSKRFLSVDSALVFRSRIPDEKILTEFDISDFDKREFNFSVMKSYLLNKVTYLDLDDMLNINEIIDNGNNQTNFQKDSDFATDWQDSFGYCDSDSDYSDSFL